MLAHDELFKEQTTAPLCGRASRPPSTKECYMAYPTNEKMSLDFISASPQTNDNYSGRYAIFITEKPQNVNYNFLFKYIFSAK